MDRGLSGRHLRPGPFRDNARCLPLDRATPFNSKNRLNRLRGFWNQIVWPESALNSA